jgi:hypothetical protein
VTPAALPLLAVPTPAHAHGGDPTLVTEYLGTSPPLPDAVVIQVRTTAGEQRVVQNNSATVLEVDDPGKRPFLRISSAGVQADVAAPFFHASLNPPDASLQLPSFAGDDAPARWEQVPAAALAATRSWWPGRRPPTAGCGWGNPERPTGSTTG